MLVLSRQPTVISKKNPKGRPEQMQQGRANYGSYAEKTDMLPQSAIGQKASYILSAETPQAYKHVAFVFSGFGAETGYVCIVDGIVMDDHVALDLEFIEDVKDAREPEAPAEALEFARREPNDSFWWASQLSFERLAWSTHDRRNCE